jgi:hypothetical protein
MTITLTAMPTRLVDRIQRLVPSLDGGDDGVGVLGPSEGPWIAVGFLDEAVDGSLQRDQRVEDAAFQAVFGQLGEEALDGVQPGGRGRREAEGLARVAGEPFADFRMLVSGIVVDDGLHQLAGRDRCLDGVEEADELLMAVALHAAADDAAVQHIECREQGGDAVADIVVRHGAAAPALERQARLGPVERLDLALFINRQHQGVRRRIDVEADDVSPLLGEVRVGGQLELPHPVRLQAMAAPDARDYPEFRVCVGRSKSRPPRRRKYRPLRRSLA